MRGTKEELNTKMAFENLMAKANEIQSLCSDEIVAVKDLHMSNDIKLNGLDLSDFALTRLCHKLHVPSRYFNRLVDNNMNDLAATNVNAWFNEDDKRKFMLRKYDGHIRGVLSDSYSKYDTVEILNSLNDVFGDSKFKLKGSMLNEERMHLRLVENEMLPIDGEDLFAGITLDSSDVGRKTLSVRFFIYKQVCTNGLVIAKSSANIFTQKHMGITHEEFKNGLETGLEKFETIKTNVSNMIENTRKIPVPNDIEEIIKNATNLSENDVEDVVTIAKAKYDDSKWGIINGITEIAQKFDLERRLQLEEIAGNMLAK